MAKIIAACFFLYDTVYVCSMVLYHVIIDASLSRGLSLTDPISILYQPCQLGKPLQQPQQLLQQLLLQLQEQQQLQQQPLQ